MPGTWSRIGLVAWLVTALAAAAAEPGAMSAAQSRRAPAAPCSGPPLRLTNRSMAAAAWVTGRDRERAWCVPPAPGNATTGHDGGPRLTLARGIASPSRVALVTLLCGEPERFLQQLRPRLAGWHENLLVPQRITVIMGVDTEGSLSLNATAQRLGLRPAAGVRLRCAQQLRAIDSGYHPYEYVTDEHGVVDRSLFLLTPFTALHALRDPAARQRADEHLRKSHPGCPGNYNYVKCNNAYTHQVLSWRILDFFDVMLRCDTDMSVLQPLPPIGRLVGRRGAWVMHTRATIDSIGCTEGLADAVAEFHLVEAQRCGARYASAARYRPPKPDPWYKTLTHMWYGNFVAYWLGVYTSPEVLRLARVYASWNGTDNMWTSRWTDQQFFPRAMALLPAAQSRRVLGCYNLRVLGALLHVVPVPEQKLTPLPTQKCAPQFGPYLTAKAP